MKDDTQRKYCTRCEIAKPISKFYATRSECKACSKFKSRRYYQTNKEKILARNEKNRLANHDRWLENQRNRYPNKRNQRPARSAVNEAIKAGRMKSKPCKVCGKRRSQFHHNKGYDKPNYLVGVWLCSLHHAEAHVIMREAKLPERDHLISKKGAHND